MPLISSIYFQVHKKWMIFDLGVLISYVAI